MARFLIRCIVCFYLLYLLGYKASYSQQITQEFELSALAENFDSTTVESLWPNINNADNLFLIDKGSYFLYRRSTSASYVILPRWSNALNSFDIKTSLKLGPSETNEQTIGVLFMGQADGKNALVFEVNKSKQYRVKQFIGDYLKYITGDKDHLGWIKNTAIKPADEYNIFEVKAFKGTYDVYINDIYLTSFAVPEYKSGGMGIVIGPATKAKCDYFYINATNDTIAKNNEVDASTKLTALITLLAEENNKLKQALDSSKYIVAANEILEKQIEEVRTENENLKNTNKSLLDTLSKLQAINGELLQQLNKHGIKIPTKKEEQAQAPKENHVEQKKPQPTQIPNKIEASTDANVMERTNPIVSVESSKKNKNQPIQVKVKKAVKKS